MYEHFIGAGAKQLIAMVSGGVAGALAFVGLSILLHRRLTDDRIRATSKPSDILISVLLWLQLALGLATIPFSAQHMDGNMMMKLAGGGSGSSLSVVVQPSCLSMRAGCFACTCSSGMTIFLIFPFTRLVHVWSGFASISYVLRPYQLVRSRRIGVGERSIARLGAR